MRSLAIVDYFLPGYKAGGPIRTLSNTIARLGNEFAFRVMTRDRDLAASDAYPNIVVDEWNRVDKAEVFYASPARHLGALVRILHEGSFDVLYLNSFFSWKSAIVPLILLRFGIARKVPVVLAPRGEFSGAALSLKASKKRLYILVARVLGLCSRVIWQASSEDEASDIRRVMKPDSSRINIAPNLLPPVVAETGESEKKVFGHRQSGPLRIVFLSRISPMKNLDFLLRVLQSIDIPLTLTIYGPAEDHSYWVDCEQLIEELPENIQVQYCGVVAANKVSEVFAQNDVFVFPTRGENFGHVIFESLNAGTPVLLSDKTPWQPDKEGAIETLSLDDRDAWVEAINRWAEPRALFACRNAARSYALQVSRSDHSLELNRQLFKNAVASGS